ncbi:MAG: hypothetical protein Tsb002_37010 [Wenzhouxiangellaceae bacterium]
MNSAQPQPNPGPVSLTTDLDVAKSDLDKHGYCLVADALTPEQVEVLRTRLLEQSEAEIERGTAFRDGGNRQDLLDQSGQFKSHQVIAGDGGVNQRIFMLANKGSCFRDLVIHPLIDDLVGHILGQDFLLSTLTANIVNPGGERMGLHTDQWWMPQPVKPGSDYRRPANITRHPAPEFIHPDSSLGIAPAVATTAVWMLSDFTITNGTTELVPGSHLSGAYPELGDKQLEYPIVQPEAPPGTLLIFDGRTWHGSGTSTGGPQRLALLSTFCAPQFRQQENQTLGLDPELWDSLSDAHKARLGYKVWNAYGRIEQEFAGYVSPTPNRVGELKPSQKSG